MPPSGVCPSCGAEQGEGLLCHAETLRIEDNLRGRPQLLGVAELVHELDILTSKQAKIGNGSGPGGLARERSPLNWKGVQGSDDLANALVYWARQVSKLPAAVFTRQPAITASQVILANIDVVRRHPDVVELIDGILEALKEARKTVDRFADRQFLGTCMVVHLDEEDQQVTCLAEIYASHGASETRCLVCGVTHEVAERRAWLLKRAEDMIVSIKDASTYLGEVGEIRVTEASIRGYVHRGKIGYRAPVEAKRIRLGDLLAVVLDEGERKSA